MLTEGHTWYQDRVVAYLDHFMIRVAQSVCHELSMDPPGHRFQDQDVPKGIMGRGIDLKSQIGSEVLKIRLGNVTGTIPPPSADRTG
ncbi:hypothetical protein DSCA_27750 [Desulfosarcina alkanivorans]|uniref:Uncharacterized protein n=1 Tax=Desulfosarcina alkanivorans TaxID=571177 RepID=A0A5K7YKD8_9BACT|nr:hypothetical protein DSCA_27750 [Desulfosarcina alkanivorans]